MEPDARGQGTLKAGAELKARRSIASSTLFFAITAPSDCKSTAAIPGNVTDLWHSADGLLRCCSFDVPTERPLHLHARKTITMVIMCILDNVYRVSVIQATNAT
mmetsp:Transcript_48680/g.85758  ORF Transcript_48680/g.85758 Transcript_48680/m.85758 type:complete len:104 (+) Transcript_48680:255-566(+)